MARGFESRGIPTVIIAWEPKRLMLVNPPRATVNGGRGWTLGQPGDTDGQRRVLVESLKLLAKDAPLEHIGLDNRE